MQRIVFFCLVCALPLLGGCMQAVFGGPKKVDGQISVAELMPKAPAPAFRDLGLERQWAQVFQRKIDAFTSKPGAFKVYSVYAAGPWNISTRAEDITDAKGNVIGTSTKRVPDYKTISVWVMGRTDGGVCGVYSFGLRYDFHGAQISSAPDELFPIADSAGRIACKKS